MITQNILSAPLIRFLIVGGASTLINYAVFLGLYTSKIADYMAASATGFIVGLVFGYFFNKRWTYGVTEAPSIKVVMSYLATYMVSLCLGIVVIRFLVIYADINPLIANFLSIALTTCTNYIGTRYMVFR